MRNRFRKRESVYKREKLAKYEHECSEVIPDFLYVGADAVAKNFDDFVPRGITHVVNCAGHTIPNYHSMNHIKYMTIMMHDDGRRSVCVKYF